MISIRKMFCAISVCATILIILYLMDVASRATDIKGRYEFINELDASPGSLVEAYRKVRPSVEKHLPTIRIALVVCGDRIQVALTLLKSALLFQLNYPMKFYIFSDDDNKQSLEEKLSDWQVLRNHSFTFEILNLQFPKKTEKQWMTLFKKCACQRLFIPDILQDVDSLLYMDADTLFVGPVYEVWRQFDDMNSSQIVALANETDDMKGGWYPGFARHPFYGEVGVNSGVMLMNLTRMRQFGWGNYLGPIYKEFKTKLAFGDQDIINIIFSYHPDKLYVFPCRYNYRTDHCRYMPNCNSAAEAGIVVLHGSRNSFLNGKILAFSAVYQVMQEYQFGQDTYDRVLSQLENTYLPDTQNSPCGLNYKKLYLTEMKRVFQPLELR